MILRQAITHVIPAASVHIDHFQIVHDGLQYIVRHDLQNCRFEIH